MAAWEEFIPGKRKKLDVMAFGARLMDNLVALHTDLANSTYQHGAYSAFKINDPKPRDIHKSSVRDRVLHHAVYRKLYPFFDRTWVSDSYSCRDGKGTHRAVNRFKQYIWKVSKNNTRTGWVLKCDIRKFFASIDHQILLSILYRYIPDTRANALLTEIVKSFYSTREGLGLPLGNLTSQLLVNIYMNEFDQFAKHRLKAKYYIRYADDFVILSEKKAELEQLLPRIQLFLRQELRLELHPLKVSIETAASGVDFLGWVHFPDHSVLRTASKKRMLRNLRRDANPTRIKSYQGMLSHGNTKKLSRTLSTISRFAV